jgi:hypothetical protein
MRPRLRELEPGQSRKTTLGTVVRFDVEAGVLAAREAAAIQKRGYA